MKNYLVVVTEITENETEVSRETVESSADIALVLGSHTLIHSSQFEEQQHSLNASQYPVDEQGKVFPNGSQVGARKTASAMFCYGEQINYQTQAFTITVIEETHLVLTEEVIRTIVF